MTPSSQRERATRVLLGQLPAELEAHADKAPVLRPREARRAAVRVLEQSAPLGAHESAALLRAALTDGDPHVRVAALLAIVTVSERALYAPLLHACALDAHELVREAAHEQLLAHDAQAAGRLRESMPKRAPSANLDAPQSCELVIDGH